MLIGPDTSAKTGYTGENAAKLDHGQFGHKIDDIFETYCSLIQETFAECLFYTRSSIPNSDKLTRPYAVLGIMAVRCTAGMKQWDAQREWSSTRKNGLSSEEVTRGHASYC